MGLAIIYGTLITNIGTFFICTLHYWYENFFIKIQLMHYL